MDQLAITTDLHVLPVDDLPEHEKTRECWCVPRVDYDPDTMMAVVIVHHALDGRELVEEHGVQ